MIKLSTEFGTLELDAGLLFSLIALAISAATFALRVWDRRPRLQVGAECFTWYYPDDDEDMPGAPGGTLLSIDIVNNSSKKVMVSSVVVDWKAKRYCGTWTRFKDIVAIGNYKATWEDFHRFWVDPWGAEARTLDCDELISRLKKRARLKKVWVSVLVTDVLGSKVRSKAISLDLS